MDEVDDSGEVVNMETAEKSGNVEPVKTVTMEKNRTVDPMNVDNVFSPRVRQYPITDKGPFLVCIRTVNKCSLESDKITKMIRKKFETEVEMKQINADKLNVLFPVKIVDDVSVNELSITSAREEANSLPKWEELNKKYRVYIPEDHVKIMGVISWAVGQSLESLTRETGKFKNSNIPNVEILEANRFTRNAVPLASTSTAPTQGKPEESASVRVTFAGLVLPEYFVTEDNLLVPVREFKKRQMFCTSCKGYRHTASLRWVSDAFTAKTTSLIPATKIAHEEKLSRNAIMSERRLYRIKLMRKCYKNSIQKR